MTCKVAFCIALCIPLFLSVAYLQHTSAEKEMKLTRADRQAQRMPFQATGSLHFYGDGRDGRRCTHSTRFVCCLTFIILLHHQLPQDGSVSKCNVLFKPTTTCDKWLHVRPSCSVCVTLSMRVAVPVNRRPQMQSFRVAVLQSGRAFDVSNICLNDLILAAPYASECDLSWSSSFSDSFLPEPNRDCFASLGI